MTNDTFITGPLEFVESRYNPNAFSAKPTRFHQYSCWLIAGERWVWSAISGDRGKVDTKEAAMAACEQHWRAEIAPALVRVESPAPRKWTAADVTLADCAYVEDSRPGNWWPKIIAACWNRLEEKRVKPEPQST